jgi:hypothetical protein
VHHWTGVASSSNILPTMASTSQSRFHEDLHDDESILDDDLIEADDGEYVSFLGVLSRFYQIGSCLFT